MTFPDLNTWIGDRPEASDVDDGRSLHDPNTEVALAASRSSSAAQVERAIGEAHTAHLDGEWSRLGVAGRAPFLLALADALDAVAEETARLDATNSGVPIAVTRLFAGGNGNTVRAVAGRAMQLGDSRILPAEQGEVRLHRVPWGVTALIVPWNAPSPMAVKNLAFAIASGAPVVLKPSPESPWSAQLIAAAAQKAGIPAGVVNVVLGGADVGQQLVSDPRVRAIAMTGSTPTGRAIAAAAGPHLTRMRLELGSNNPAVVRADADLEQAATNIVAGFLKLSGQWCEAPRRVIVDRAVLPQLTEALTAEIATWRVGSSLDDDTQLGPVAFESRRTALEAQCDELARSGAHIVHIGEPRDRGWFFRPTLAIGEAIDPATEIFGPMITIEPSDGDAHAIARANTGLGGLAGYVFSADESAARIIGASLDAGEIKINGTSVLDMSPESAQSFFGSSGLGGHGDADLFDFFSGKRIVGTDIPGLPL